MRIYMLSKHEFLTDSSWNIQLLTKPQECIKVNCTPAAYDDDFLELFCYPQTTFPPEGVKLPTDSQLKY